MPRAEGVSVPAERPSPLSLAQQSALVLLRGYKILISPMFAGSCRFLPSCSDYAAEAVVSFGVLRGSFLAACRLARCHPLGTHGLDPVPGRSHLGTCPRKRNTLLVK